METEVIRPRKRKGGAKDVVLIALALLLVGGLLGARMFWAQPYRIPSASMAPTLEPGEYILARNVSPDALRVGDVVVHRRDQGDGPRDFIRRVLALPGQRISLELSAVSLDGVPVDAVQVGPAADARYLIYRETLAGRSYLVQHLADASGPVELQNVAEIVVPEGHVFLVGDNRDNSLDSRMEGPYPIADVHHAGGWIIYSPISNRAGKAIE